MRRRENKEDNKENKGKNKRRRKRRGTEGTEGTPPTPRLSYSDPLYFSTETSPYSLRAPPSPSIVAYSSITSPLSTATFSPPTTTPAVSPREQPDLTDPERFIEVYIGGSGSGSVGVFGSVGVWSVGVWECGSVWEWEWEWVVCIT
jgi:hypothetical protein